MSSIKIELARLHFAAAALAQAFVFQGGVALDWVVDEPGVRWSISKIQHYEAS